MRHVKLPADVLERENIKMLVILALVHARKCTLERVLDTANKVHIAKHIHNRPSCESAGAKSVTGTMRRAKSILSAPISARRFWH